MEMLNLSKEQSDNLLNLRKEKIQTLCLQKPILADTKARVSLVLDYSGSMRTMYNNGTVQAIIERILPIAMKFDDDGEMELWIFENGFKHLEPINLSNYYGYVKDKIMSKYSMGGTKYTPVIKDIEKTYMEDSPMKISNYVIFITDGDNDTTDKKLATEAIIEVSKKPIFFQFVGIGHKENEFKYLRKLDEMDGRYVDNANFFAIEDINSETDDDIYNKLLAEFPGWLELPEVKEMIANQPDKPKKKGLFGLFK